MSARQHTIRTQLGLFLRRAERRRGHRIDPAFQTRFRTVLLGFSVLILRAGWRVVRESAHILLEGTPPGFDVAAITADLTAAVPDVAAVRHVHAWSINEARPMVTLEAVIAGGGDAEAARRAIKARLAERFGFDHATVETCTPTEERELPTPAAARI